MVIYTFVSLIELEGYLHISLIDKIDAYTTTIASLIKLAVKFIPMTSLIELMVFQIIHTSICLFMIEYTYTNLEFTKLILFCFKPLYIVINTIIEKFTHILVF